MSQRNYPAFSYSLPPIVIGLDWAKAFVYYPDGFADGEPVGDPFDFTDWTGEAQVRAKATDTEALVVLTVELGDDGTVGLTADADVTAEAEAHDKAVWDLITTDPDGETERFAAGTVAVIQPVTQPVSP